MIAECEAVISDPLNEEGRAPWWLTVLDINETHPAVVRCQVTCLDQQGFYRPAMALIITSQEQFIPVSGYRDTVYSRDGLHSEIRIGDFSHCEAQNNYTMEFEYLITANTSKINHSVVICGVVFHDWPPYLQHTCWGQSYGIIRHNSALDAYYTVPMASTNTESTHDQPHTGYSTDEHVYTLHSQVGTAPALSSMSVSKTSWLVSTVVLVFVINILMSIIILLSITAFIRMKSQRRLNVIAPQCVQTVEQTLVIKVEQPSDSEKEVKEKETPLDEDSNLSSVQVQLQQKLPDTINSRSKTW